MIYITEFSTDILMLLFSYLSPIDAIEFRNTCKYINEIYKKVRKTQQILKYEDGMEKDAFILKFKKEVSLGNRYIQIHYASELMADKAVATLEVYKIVNITTYLGLKIYLINSNLNGSNKTKMITAEGNARDENVTILKNMSLITKGSFKSQIRGIICPN